MELPGTSQGRSYSFESLTRTLSSDDGRGSLYTLPIAEAIAVIDALEKVSAKQCVP